MKRITAHTRVAAVIGWPVSHSLSPIIHNAAFESTGVDAVYVAFAVSPGSAAEALASARSLELLGLSVTMPHKTDVAHLVDEVSPASATLDSVNTVEFSGGRAIGHSTDGDGLVASLRADGVDVAGSRALVLGAGGAARSVVDALRRHAAADVVVANRTLDNARRAAELGPVGTAAIEIDDVSVARALEASDIVINCTSVGMGSSDRASESPIPLSGLTSRHVVVDLVYHPLVTPFMRYAERIGCRIIGGLGMLVHQAALQQVIWTGHEPDVAAMSAAARQALG
jgi:shikimate dehydrogenase